MKHGKRPTRAQKNVIKANGLNPNNWLVTKNLQHEHRLIIVHRNTGTVEVLGMSQAVNAERFELALEDMNYEWSLSS